MKLIRRLSLCLLLVASFASAQVQDPSLTMQTFVEINESERKLVLNEQEYRLALSARYWSPEKDRLTLEELIDYIGYSATIKRNERGDVLDLYLKEAY